MEWGGVGRGGDFLFNPLMTAYVKIPLCPLSHQIIACCKIENKNKQRDKKVKLLSLFFIAAHFC